MRYEDESKTASGLGDMKAMGGREFLPIVIPEVEAVFVLLETLHKGGSILHNVFALMTINIHTVFLSPIPPSQCS